jgi:hypothetical protein
MIRTESLTNLSDLYHTDETAWLEQMAALAAAGETSSMDLKNLSEYLSDMARRDKREVVRRLVVLLTHLLKWEHQPEKRSRSWELTIQEQREELAELLESGVLRNHARQQLDKAYRRAVRRTAVESELAEETFPGECPYTLEQALGE